MKEEKMYALFGKKKQSVWGRVALIAALALALAAAMVYPAQGAVPPCIKTGDIVAEIWPDEAGGCRYVNMFGRWFRICR